MVKVGEMVSAELGAVLFRYPIAIFSLLIILDLWRIFTSM